MGASYQEYYNENYGYYDKRREEEREKNRPSNCPEKCTCLRPTINDMTGNWPKKNVICTTCNAHHFDGKENTKEEWEVYINQEEK